MKFWALVISFITLMINNVWASELYPKCSLIDFQPEINIKTSYGQLIHDLSNSTQSINTMAKQSGLHAEGGIFAEGLATVEMKYGVVLSEIKLKNIGNNEACIIPTKIDVVLGYSNPVIYVSNNYDKHSCRFGVILRHEQTHQRINKLLLDYFLPLAEDGILRAINDVQSISTPTDSQEIIKARINEMSEHYMDRLSPIVNELEVIRAAEHKKLDNTSNYQFEWELCKKSKK